MVTGPLGTLIVSHRFTFNQPGLAILSSFADDLTPDLTPCTGDPYAVGNFGWRIESLMENTDPRLEEVFGVTWEAISERALFFAPPKQKTNVAELHNAQHLAPIEVTAIAFGPKAVSAPPDPPKDAVSVESNPAGSLVQILQVPGAAGLTWTVAKGDLPIGIELDPSGVLRGTTVETGDRHLVLRAEHPSGSVLVEVELRLPPPSTPGLLQWVRSLPLIGRWLSAD